MNNFSYPFIPINNNQNILEELIKINENLKKIEFILNKQIENKNNNKYLEKDENYYMI